MKNQKKNIIAIVTIILIALVAGAAIFISYKVGSQQAIAPTAPGQSRAASCEEACPYPKEPNLLASCTPGEADGSPTTSVCDNKGRVEVCGNKNYCCPAPGGSWTTDMTACPTASPTAAPTDVAGQQETATGTYVEDAKCAASFTVTEVCTLVPPVWSEWSECSKSCGGGIQTRTCSPGTCGGAENCNALDSGNSSRACNTEVCESNISIDKKAFQDESENSDGNYTLSQEIDAVSKNQVFVYTILIKNNTEATAEGVSIKDPLTGLNQDKITFKDNESTCSYSASDNTVNCNTSLDPGQTKKFSFRATVSDSVVNGTLIKNIATVTHLGHELKAEKDLLVSTIVSCNHTCTSDSECNDGLTCDTGTNKCRNAECVTTASCVCPTPTVVRPRVTATTTPRPTVLPETGILDITGVATFGGGLILAVVGILLAL